MVIFIFEHWRTVFARDSIESLRRYRQRRRREFSGSVLTGEDGKEMMDWFAAHEIVSIPPSGEFFTWYAADGSWFELNHDEEVLFKLRWL